MIMIKLSVLSFLSILLAGEFGRQFGKEAIRKAIWEGGNSEGNS